MESTQKNLKLKPYQQTSFDLTLQNENPTPDFPLLPLIHKVDSVRNPNKENPTSFDYFISGYILPTFCDVFGENLIYTFVGRPAYREYTTPVCFILKPEARLLQNLFLFDTGGFFDNRYSKIIDAFMDINLFRIPADSESIRKFIYRCYGNNEAYIRSISKNIDLFTTQNSEEEFAYLMLEHITNFQNVEFDSRCRTLENIIRTPINLYKYTMGIIMPKSQIKFRFIHKFLKMKRNKIDIMLYDDNSDIDNNKAVDDILYRYYQRKGYFSS